MKHKKLYVTYVIFVHKKVSSLQVSMDDTPFMQVAHPLTYINCKLQEHCKLHDVMLLVHKVI
jgi:hypothetical protein